LRTIFAKILSTANKQIRKYTVFIELRNILQKNFKKFQKNSLQIGHNVLEYVYVM
jgi:hypothetical protein